MSQNAFVKIDSHAHLTSDALFPDLDQVIARAQKNGVVAVVNINTDEKSLERGLECAKKYPGYFFNTAATTPHDVNTDGEKDFPLFRERARKGDLIALGETGLDYHYEYSERELQKDFFQRYLSLGEELNLPVVIHCRGKEAFNDLFEISKKFPKVACLLHCFTGDSEDVIRGLERGWYFSLSGILTFKKSEALRQVAKKIPLDRILIETDAPYLAPETKRGKLNEPAFLDEVLTTIAFLKEASLENLSEQIGKNTCAFFRLSSNLLKK